MNKFAASEWLPKKQLWFRVARETSRGLGDNRRVIDRLFIAGLFAVFEHGVLT